MSDKIDNPAAFPKPGDHRLGHDGMSLRDWFAGQAMAGICASGPSNSWSDDRIARESYGIADAMLAARAKTEGK